VCRDVRPTRWWASQHMIQHGPTASHSMYGTWCATAPRFAHLGQGQAMCGCVGSVLDMSRELALAKTRDAICNVRHAGGHDLSTCRAPGRPSKMGHAQKSMGRIDTHTCAYASLLYGSGPGGPLSRLHTPGRASDPFWRLASPEDDRRWARWGEARH